MRRPVVIDTRLNKNQFMLLSFWQHISRKTFYFFAITCAAITLYVVLVGNPYLFFVGWIPLVLYILSGIVGAIWNSRNTNHPSYLLTHYELSETGIAMSNELAKSQLGWETFTGWRTMIDCYVLLMPGERMIAIPRASIPNRYIGEVKEMLTRYIDERKR